MRKFLNSFISTSVMLLSPSALGGFGWYVTVANPDPERKLTISPAGSDCFYEEALGTVQTVEPNSTRTFYIEDKHPAIGPCAFTGFKVIGVDFEIGGQVEHIEFQALRGHGSGATHPIGVAYDPFFERFPPEETNRFFVLRESLSEAEQVQLAKDGNVHVTLSPNL